MKTNDSSYIHRIAALQTMFLKCNVYKPAAILHQSSALFWLITAVFQKWTASLYPLHRHSFGRCIQNSVKQNNLAALSLAAQCNYDTKKKHFIAKSATVSKSVWYNQRSGKNVGSHIQTQVNSPKDFSEYALQMMQSAPKQPINNNMVD